MLRSYALLVALSKARSETCQVLRDLFANPCRPRDDAAAWLVWNGGVVGRLAEKAYNEREEPSGFLD